MSDDLGGGGDLAAGLGADAVRIELPAQSRSLRLLRLAAADAAGDLGFGVDRVESARIAVDELAAVLVEESDADRLHVAIGRDRGTLVVEGWVPTRSAQPPHLDRIVTELLEVCSERWALVVEDGRLVFRLSVSA